MNKLSAVGLGIVAALAISIGAYALGNHNDGSHGPPARMASRPVATSPTPRPTATPLPAANSPIPTMAQTPQPSIITTLCGGQWTDEGTTTTVQVSISGPGETCTTLTPAPYAQFESSPNALAPISASEWSTGNLVVACTTSIPGAAISVWTPNMQEDVYTGRDICAEQLQPIETATCKAAGGYAMFDAGGAAQCNLGDVPCATNPANRCEGPTSYYSIFNTNGTVNTTEKFDTNGQRMP